MKIIKTILIIFNFLTLIFIFSFLGIRELVDFEYVDNLPTGAIFTKTKYVYDWPNNPGVVYDDNNLIKTIYGYNPPSTIVSVHDKLRIITFVNDGAIIKTQNDSVEIGEKESHHKGWMGIWSNCRQLAIDQNGIVQELCK